MRACAKISGDGSTGKADRSFPINKAGAPVWVAGAVFVFACARALVLAQA